jgi:hypothetical protein
MPWRHMGEQRHSSTILDLGTRWRRVVSFTPRLLQPPGKSPPPVPINYEGGWALEPVWSSWRREKSWPCRRFSILKSIIVVLLTVGPTMPTFAWINSWLSSVLRQGFDGVSGLKHSHFGLVFGRRPNFVVQAAPRGFGLQNSKSIYCDTYVTVFTRLYCDM